MAGYRGGICSDLAHERGHMLLFSRLPGGQPGATWEANPAKQQWFSPADAAADFAPVWATQQGLTPVVREVSASLASPLT
jgi:hypothetical protein